MSARHPHTSPRATATFSGFSASSPGVAVNATTAAAATVAAAASAAGGASSSTAPHPNYREFVYAFLLLLLWAWNAYVYSFSSMKSLQNVRISFWVIAPVITMIWYLAFVRNRFRLTGAMSLVLFLIAVRFFYGRLCVVTGLCPSFTLTGAGKKPSLIHAVLFTEADSPRGDFVPTWFNKLIPDGKIRLEVDLDNPVPGTYTQELGYVPGDGACDNAMLHHQHLVAYVYRFKRYLMRQPAERLDVNEWYLILENDAQVVYPKSFQRTLERLTTYTDVDFIFLDFRNIAADYSSLIVYAGANGMLIRRGAFPRIIAELSYNADTCRQMPWPMSPDSLLGVACKMGRLKCFSHPLLTEHGFPSSLHYGRDTLLGEQSAGLYEWNLTNTLCLALVFALYWKKRTQWRIHYVPHLFGRNIGSNIHHHHHHVPPRSRGASLCQQLDIA